MTDEDLRVQMAAASSLGRIGPAAAETIVSALSMAEGPLKAALIRTLGQVGHPEAQDILRGMCKETADVALAALEALCALGLDAEEIQDEILGHPDSEVVKQALSLFGANVSSARLEKLLRHCMWDVRLAAVDRLALEQGDEVAAALKEHMKKEPDDLVKRAIGRVLDRR
jgi:HEAT repeat protein